jgi:ubiquinone/menaquinone biosynthesis C-methylase UbiE
MAAMRRFLDDFPQGLEAKRYRAEVLTSLLFQDRAFDLALCSHFLLTFSDHLSKDFHVAAIEEMCRVSGEARVFPLLESYAVHTRLVPCVFQHDGNRMLVASHKPAKSSGT